MMLKNWLKGLALLVLGAAVLAGCDEDDSDTKNNGIQLQTIAGGTVSAEGTWVSTCEDNGGDGNQEIMIFEEDVVTGYSRTWSGDTSCSGDFSEEQMTFYVTAEVAGTGTATWGGGVAPDADYPDEVEVSQVDFEAVENPEFVGSDILVIDDEADPMLIYTGVSENTPLGEYDTELAVSPSAKADDE